MTAARPIGDYYNEPVDDFDGDCDGYPQDYALLAKIEAGNRAERVKRELDEAMSLAPVERISPTRIAL